MSKKAYLYGIHAVSEALKQGESLEKIWVDKGAKGKHMGELVHLARNGGVPIQYVPEAALKKYSTKNHQGVVALGSPIQYVAYEEIVTRVFESGGSPLILILDGITDVRNFGAISRSALCMGAHLIILPIKGSAIIQEDAIKTSAGALFQIPVSRVHNLAETARYLKDSGVALIACSEKGASVSNEVDLRKPLALIVGSEETGISNALLQEASEHVRIPMKNALDSLNVSVAMGMLLYETARQRGFSFDETEVHHF